MEDNETDRDDESAEQESRPGGESREHPARRADRRMDDGGLFGGYQGPERRSGRDRRSAS